MTISLFSWLRLTAARTWAGSWACEPVPESHVRAVSAAFVKPERTVDDAMDAS